MESLIIYREALHEASDELVEEVVEDKDVSSFGERLSCDDTSATLLNCWDSLLLLELVKLLERGLEVLRLRMPDVVVVVVVLVVVFVVSLFRIRFRSSVNLA